MMTWTAVVLVAVLLTGVVLLVVLQRVSRW